MELIYDYLPIFLIVIFAVLFAAGSIIASSLVKKKHPNPSKSLPYECGMEPLASAKILFPIRFYLVALLFLLFDMETVYILAWAIIFGVPSLRMFALAEMLVFMGFLLVGYIYVWKKGALTWV